MPHGEGCGFRAIPSSYLGVYIGDVALHGPAAKHQRLSDLTISLTLCEEAQYLPLTLRHVRGIFHNPFPLGSKAFPQGGHLLHEWPHTKICGDVQGLSQQNHGIGHYDGTALLGEGGMGAGYTQV